MVRLPVRWTVDRRYRWTSNNRCRVKAGLSSNVNSSFTNVSKQNTILNKN
jgi:hypothetical protein